MSDAENYPPDVEPLPKDHDLFKDLCTLVEEYEEETGRTREEIFYDINSFYQHWIETLHLTGATW